MFLNYLKITLRNLKRQKGYSFINIFGLAIGMASAILILFWIQDELSYDRFHTLSDRLYRVTDYERYSNGEEIIFSMNPADLAPTLLENIPEIINTCRLRSIGSTRVSMLWACRNHLFSVFCTITPLAMSYFNTETTDLMNPDLHLLTHLF